MTVLAYESNAGDVFLVKKDQAWDMTDVIEEATGISDLIALELDSAYMWAIETYGTEEFDFEAGQPVAEVHDATLTIHTDRMGNAARKYFGVPDPDEL